MIRTTAASNHAVRSLPPGKFTTPLALPETVISCQEIQILAQSTPDLKKHGEMRMSPGNLSL